MKSGMRFQNQIALVVGGAQGIGKAIALRLGREGASVIIADIDSAMMDHTTAEMRAEGSEVFSLFCDVLDSAQVKLMVDQVLNRHGRIDILMYVAGIAPSVPFLQMNEETWDNTMNVNLRGAFLVSRAVTPHMVARKRGKLVFMASTNSWDGETQLAHYNASKAGLFLLAKTLARELGPYGINSNAVGPGLIWTRLTEPHLRTQEQLQQSRYDPAKGLIPLGRLGMPDDVAGPALFLASDDAGYVNGVLLFVDGGQLA